MKKFIYLSILAIMLVVGIVLAQKNNGLTIHDRWKKVEELAEKQLPESALKEVELILKDIVFRSVYMKCLILAYFSRPQLEHYCTTSNNNRRLRFIKQPRIKTCPFYNLAIYW